MDVAQNSRKFGYGRFIELMEVPGTVINSTRENPPQGREKTTNKLGKQIHAMHAVHCGWHTAYADARNLVHTIVDHLCFCCC